MIFKIVHAMITIAVMNSIILTIIATILSSFCIVIPSPSYMAALPPFFYFQVSAVYLVDISSLIDLP